MNDGFPESPMKQSAFLLALPLFFMNSGMARSQTLKPLAPSRSPLKERKSNMEPEFSKFHRSPKDALPKLSREELLDEVQKRAFRFLWERTDATTGLVNDRANNTKSDEYTVASIASTGYALAALPIAVERKWVTREEAEKRARVTLDFFLAKTENQHGWFYHFVDGSTGKRVWNCEVSTIDTALLMTGTLVCGQYFKGDIQRSANAIYDRLDWDWVRTNGGAKPDKLTVSHGWTPENGFIPNEWGDYCELMQLYLLGMGAKKAPASQSAPARNPLPPESWTAWKRQPYSYGGRDTLAGGPIFMHQMSHLYFDFKGRRDILGYDYYVCSVNATLINRQFCIDHSMGRKSYSPDIWGLNAADGPDGYSAYGVPAPEDGTVSPTGALSSLQFTPELSLRAAETMYANYGDKIWGKYGFADSFNLDKNWFDPDVIGIDLGMAILAVENYRTGKIWKLMASHPSMKAAWKAAGFHPTKESGNRKLFLNPG